MTPEIQLACFIELLKHEGIYHRLPYDKRFEPVLVGFTLTLMAAADRYRFDESYKDLMEVAARELIAEHKNELFTELVKTCRLGAYSPLLGNFVPELVTYIKYNRQFKNLVSGLLKRERDITFEKSCYTYKLADMIREEHPMVTFVKAIDYIESTKGTPAYKTNIPRKRENWKNLRVGYTALDKSDWKSSFEFVVPTPNLFESMNYK